MPNRDAVAVTLMLLLAGCAGPSDPSPAPVISVSPPVPAVIALGDTLVLAAEVDGDPSAGVAWTSSAPEVLSVTREGVVRALRAGSAVLEAASSGVRRQFPVSVAGELVIETIPRGLFPLFEGDVFEVEAWMRGGTVLGTRPMEWSATGPEGFSLMPLEFCDPTCRHQPSAYVRAGNPGPVEIRFQYGAATASLRLVVAAPPQGVPDAIPMVDRFLVWRFPEWWGGYGYYPLLRVREAGGVSDAIVTRIIFRMEGIQFGETWWDTYKEVPAGGTAELISDNVYGDWEVSFGSNAPADTVSATIQYRDKQGRVGSLVARTAVTVRP